MKARIKKTGEIVNIADYATIALESCDSWGIPIELKPEEIELMQDSYSYDEEKHWQDVRERAAIAAMHVILNGNFEIYEEEQVAQAAVEYADALVNELKKK